MKRDAVIFRPLLIGFFFLFALFSTASAFASSGGRDKVAEGVRLFKSGDLDGAVRAFQEADVSLPGDLSIAYDKGCVYQAQGALDKAREMYTRAALARDADLAAAARFNMGALDVEKARKVFGDHPEAAPPEQRKEGLADLNLAVRHFRDCLDVKPDHAAARRNLEGIRLWVKHMTALWEEADRRKKRKELDVLSFLEMIRKAQLEIRDRVKELAPEPDSPKRREAVSVAESDQRKLKEEIPYLKDKIAGALNPQGGKPGGRAGPAPGKGGAPPGSSAASGGAEEVEKALGRLDNWADEAAAKMAEAADRLDGGSPGSALDSQWEAYERLDRIYGALAPFPSILAKAVAAQKDLVDKTSPAVEGAAPAGKTAGAPAGKTAEGPAGGSGKGEAAGSTSGSAPDWKDLGNFQDLVTRFAGILPYKAKAMEEQLAAAGKKAGEKAGKKAGQKTDEKRGEEVEKLKKACAKACELAPEIGDLSGKAAGFLKKEKAAEALPKEEKALSLLKEIADLMPKQKKQQQKQQQQSQQQQKQQQQKQQQQKKNQTNNNQQKQNRKKLSREEAATLLRKASEKEREHKEKKKELMKALGRKTGVDKDW